MYLFHVNCGCYYIYARFLILKGYCSCVSQQLYKYIGLTVYDNAEAIKR